MKRNRNRWVRTVALILILALVLGLVATGLFLAFSGSKSVVGTYAASDGRKMTLAKGGVATLTVPSVQQPIVASYKVEGDVVTIYDPAAGSSNGISFTIKGNDLEGADGSSWVKQAKE